MNPTNDPSAVPPPPNGSQPVVGAGASPQPQVNVNPTVPPQAMPPVAPPTPPPSGGVTGIPLDSLKKQKTQIWLMIAGSFAVFVLGLLIGFAALVGLFLGAFATRKARLINYEPGMIVALIATLLNVSLYLLVIFVKLH
jgi:hypothetical protein